MNIRPKFHAWLRSEVEFHTRTPHIKPEELERLKTLLNDIELDNPGLRYYYVDRAGVAVPGTRPNEPLRAADAAPARV